MHAAFVSNKITSTYHVFIFCIGTDIMLTIIISYWSFVWKTLLDARLKADDHVDYGQIGGLFV